MKGNTLDIHQEITTRIITAIEAGTAEGFRLPWNSSGASGRPVNILSKKTYNGVNVLSLWIAALHYGYAHPIWGTYRQWQEKGAQVRKGEKASLVVFYKTYSADAESAEGQDQEPQNTERLVARASWVFNADQVDGYQNPNPLPSKPVFEPVEAAERFAGRLGAQIRESGSKAFYSPSDDVVNMPDRIRFHGTETMSAGEAYYATLMHELTHWSGAPARLDRDLKNRFGSEAYAMEELVAELGSAFLCADLGITAETRPDHASYIANWLKVLKSDKKAIFTAASKAQQAVDYLTAHAASKA